MNLRTITSGFFGIRIEVHLNELYREVSMRTFSFNPILATSMLLFCLQSIAGPLDNEISTELRTGAFAKPHKFSGSFKSERRFAVSLAPSYWYYSEPGIMSIDGPAVRLKADWKDRFGDSSFLYGLQGEYTQGAMRYDGRLQNGTPLQSKSFDSASEIRALLQADLVDTFDQNFGFYSGFGYRYWFNLVQSPGGYRREITYQYVPIGAEYSVIWTTTSLILYSEYDLFLGGTVKSYLSDVNASKFDDIENTQASGSGQGLRFGARISWASPSESVASYFIEPQWSYWRVDESDRKAGRATTPGTTTYYFEPENETSIFLIDAGLTF